MSYTLAYSSEESPVELSIRGRGVDQPQSNENHVAKLPAASVTEQDLAEEEDFHLLSIRETMSKRLPQRRRYRYIVWLPLWVWYHLLDFSYRSLAVDRFRHKKKAKKPPGKLGNSWLAIQRGWSRVPPRLAWRKMLLLWTCLNWLACAGFCTFLVLQKSSIVDIEKVRSIPCSHRRFWQVLVLSLPLNILGSLLVAASSFTRQILMSPTRQQLDRAHRKGRSLAVAMPSMRNLRSMGGLKAMIWILLAITSFPFHFL